VIGGGYTEFVQFQWFTRKPLGSLVDPQSQDRRIEDRGVRRRSLETSKRRTHIGIAWLALRLSKFAVVGHPSNGAMTKISEFALEGHVSLVS
jgi:hypothetical protein